MTGNCLPGHYPVILVIYDNSETQHNEVIMYSY